MAGSFVPRVNPLEAHVKTTLALLNKPSVAQPAVKRAVADHYAKQRLPVRTGRLAASLRQQRGGAVYVSKSGVLVVNRVPYALYVVMRQAIPDPPADVIVKALGDVLLDPRKRRPLVDNTTASGGSPSLGGAP